MSTRIRVLVTVVIVCCTLLLSLVAFTGSVLAASPPTVHVNPSAVTPDSAGCVSFTVAGNNFTPGAVVQIFFDGFLIGGATADSKGDFTASEYVCGLDTPGRHAITVLSFPIPSGGAGTHLTVKT